MWAKLDADLDLNPKIRRAGRDGREVFAYVLRVNARTGHTGRVRADHLDPDIVAPILMCTEADVLNGLQRAVTARLLVVDGEDIVIVGWDADEWGRGADGSLTEAERKRRQRAAKAAKSGQEPDIVRTPSGRVETPVRTSGPSEERRGEENRSGGVGFDAARHTPTDSVQTEIDTMGGIIPFPTPAEAYPAPPLPTISPQIASTLRPAAPGRTKGARLADSPHFAAAHRLWTRQENARRALNPRTRHLDLTGKLGVERLKRVIDRMNDGWTEAQLEQVVDSFAARCRNDPEQMQWFNGDTNWRRDNVDREYGKLGAPRNGPKPAALDKRDAPGGATRVPSVAETKAATVTVSRDERMAAAATLADLRAKGLAP